MATQHEDLVAAARHRVRYPGDAATLEALWPGEFPEAFASGDGVYLIAEDGRRVLDAGNHLGATAIGHARGDMADAIADQVRTLEFSGLQPGATHPYVVRLAERLADLMPLRDPIFSFTSTGSEANDLAFKLARDYHRRRGHPEKTKILSRKSSYHGSTYGAISATGIEGFRAAFEPLVQGFVKLPHPFPGYCGFCQREGGCTEQCVDATVQIVEAESPDTIAAIIAEPVSIASVGVKVPPASYWPRLREICDQYDILLIADEVVTGFGRIGKMFGCEHWDIEPDMLTFAKGITSGYIPMGGVAATRQMQEAFSSAPFMNINTYAGHPVACAAAMKTLDIIENEGLVERSATGGTILREEFERIARDLPLPARASALGLMGSLEFFLNDEADTVEFAAQIWHACYVRGVLARAATAANVASLFFYPALTIEESVLREALAQVGEAAQEVAAAATGRAEP